MIYLIELNLVLCFNLHTGVCFVNVIIKKSVHFSLVKKKLYKCKDQIVNWTYDEKQEENVIVDLVLLYLEMYLD
jgi:hypothetical protein